MTRPLLLLLLSCALAACGPGEIDAPRSLSGANEPDRSGEPAGVPDPLAAIRSPQAPQPALPELAAPAPELPDLLRLFMTGAPGERDGAGQALARLGPAVIPHFLEEVRKQGVKAAEPGKPSWQSHAVALMSELGPAALPTLERGLYDQNRDVRLVSVLSLALMGAGAGPVRASLERALSDPDEKIRLAAVGALQKIDPPPPAPAGEPVRIEEPGGERHVK